MEKKYDLIVIGTGPAGEKAAVKAAYFGYKVAIIDKQRPYGGAAVVTGTLPSKTLKETALYFSGVCEKGLYGVDKQLERATSIADFMYRKNSVTCDAAYAVETNLILHEVDRYEGVASFFDPHTIEIDSGSQNEKIHGEYIIIATGSYPVHPKHIDFSNPLIHDSDSILDIQGFPKSLCIVGAGVIGCEYSTIFSTIGTKVHLVNDRSKILPFIDSDVSNELVNQMQQSGVNILFNIKVKSVEPVGNNESLAIQLETGETLETDMFLFAAGRSGQIKQLNCEKIGLETGRRETIVVDDTYQTNIPHIFAVGDVIGFPALASTSMDQGRVAVAHIFKTEDLNQLSKTFPLGIYTIPEVSTVGVTEEQAMEQGLNYGSGMARYRDMPRGKILGEENNGFLKIIFELDTKQVLGVHIIGPLATEIIHFGLTLVEDKKIL
ncbi:MAG: Si-specific NAD(P)(+) transhydrogenase, partial [Bacteroidota bacterium]